MPQDEAQMQMFTAGSSVSRTAQAPAAPAANSRFSRFLGLCTTLGGAVANTRLVTAPARAVQGVSSRVAQLMKPACNATVKAGQTVGIGMAEILRQIFGEFHDTKIYLYRRTDEVAVKDFDLAQALASHGQLVDKANKYVFRRYLGAGLLAAAIGWALSRTPSANTQMGPIAPLTIGVATAALARKFFQARAHYRDIAYRAKRIEIVAWLAQKRDNGIGNVGLDVEQAFKNAIKKHHPSSAGLNAVRRIFDQIKYNKDAFETGPRLSVVTKDQGICCPDL
jgi:hypothetical protein